MKIYFSKCSKILFQLLAFTLIANIHKSLSDLIQLRYIILYKLFMYPLSRKSTIICTYVKCLIETAWRYLSEKINSTSIHKMIFDSITHYITWKLVWCNSHENNLTGAPMEWHFLILMMLFNRWMFYKMYTPIT